MKKTGIMRPGKPFIYADVNPPASIMERANHSSVTAFYLKNDYSFTEDESHWTFHYANQQIQGLIKPDIQLKSAAAAVLATRLLDSYLPVSYDSLQAALQKIFIPGRLQLEEGKVNILYDVAHNPQSVRLLADTLTSMVPQGKIHAVFSALKDKDIVGLIEPLKNKVAYWYPAQLEVKRAASVNLLLSSFASTEIFLKICYDSPLIALKAALDQATEGDLVVVYGSFFYSRSSNGCYVNEEIR